MRPWRRSRRDFSIAETARDAALRQEGEALLRQGKLAEAEGLFQAMLERAPGNVDLLNALGLIAMRGRRAADAVRLYRAAVAAAPSQAELLINLGAALAAAGEFDEAERVHQDAVGRLPGMPQAHAAHGNILASRGRFDVAAEAYGRALTLDPAAAPVLLRFADVEERRGRLAEAVEAGAKAAAADSGNPRAHYLHGRLLRRLGRPAEAAQALRQALTLQPDYAEAYDQLGVALQDQDLLFDATACYTRALVLYPDLLRTLVNLGAALIEQRRPQEAEGHLRRALSLRSDDAFALNNLGAALKLQRRLLGAVEVFRQALAIMPNHPEAPRNLASVLPELDERDEAIKVVDDWLQREPDNVQARHLRVSIGGERVPEQPDTDYVRTTFDKFARTFDRTLAGIGYQAPAVIGRAVERFFPKAERRLDVLDAGCGTGLSGPPLRRVARRLDGVDLSAAMLEKAREREVYDSLAEGEITAFLAGRTRNYDLIAAADVLCYFGALGGVFRAARRALKPGGMMIFTVENRDDLPAEPGYGLALHGRYGHSEAYIRAQLNGADLALVSLEPVTLRAEEGEDVRGLLVAGTRKLSERKGEGG